MIIRRVALVVALAVPSITHPQASSNSLPDSLRLTDVRLWAAANDPRSAQLELLASQSALRLRSIRADLLPAISLDGFAQYQSDVASIGVNLPGITLPTPTNDTYDARVGAQQRIYDPSIGPRRAVERAQLAESQARVRSALYSLNESATTAFFIALRSQMQIDELDTTLKDLEAQLGVATSRVKEGAALPSEANALRAELLRRRQAVAEQRAARNAAIAVLSDITGKAIDPDARLAIPDLADQANQARSSLASIRSRPEYQQFARTRDVLNQTARASSAQAKPRISAFGRLGYGRPGLNPLSDKFDTYWLSGLQLQWTPFTWGAPSRDRQVADLQRQIVATEEQAFTQQLQRGVEQDLATIDRVESSLAEDDEIIALRENIFAEARARYRESAITSAEYVDRQTDVLSARLGRALHRADLAQARAHLLTTIGMEVR
jgi:outer membrane protein TolC